MSDQRDPDLDYPVHVADVAGTSIRFFAAPHDRLPWAVLHDVLQAARVPAADHGKITDFVRSAPYADGLNAEEAEWATPSIVVTPKGEEIVCGLVPICGLLGSAITSGAVAEAFASEFRSAVESALHVMHGGKPPSDLIGRVRIVAMVMYRFDEAQPS